MQGLWWESAWDTWEPQGEQSGGSSGEGPGSAGVEARLHGVECVQPLKNHGLLFRMKWEALEGFGQRVTSSDSL